MRKLLTTGTLTSYRPRVDGSFSLSVNIMIPSREQKETIDALFQQEVIIYLKEGTEVHEEEIEVIDEVDIDLGNTKTPSQRLRSIFFVLFKQNNEGFLDFKEFYKMQMNRLCEHFKSKIE